MHSHTTTQSRYIHHVQVQVQVYDVTARDLTQPHHVTCTAVHNMSHDHMTSWYTATLFPQSRDQARTCSRPSREFYTATSHLWHHIMWYDIIAQHCTATTRGREKQLPIWVPVAWLCECKYFFDNVAYISCQWWPTYVINQRHVNAWFGDNRGKVASKSIRGGSVLSKPRFLLCFALIKLLRVFKPLKTYRTLAKPLG